MAKKTIMRALKINEISGVDVPAQQGALVSIMKRAEGDAGSVLKSKPIVVEANVEKGGTVVLLSSPYEGHTHAVCIYPGDTGGMTTGGSKPSTIPGEHVIPHDHPWTMNADGTITIGENDGHSHVITDGSLLQALVATAASRMVSDVTCEVGKQDTAEQDECVPDASATNKADDTAGDEAGNSDVGNEEIIEMTDMEKQVAELQARLVKAEQLAGLNDAEKAHFAGLAGDAAEAFLAKSSDERSAEVSEAVAKAAEADPVVYTTLDGTELRKSAGEALVAMAKRADEAEAKLAKADQEAAEAKLAKRADDELSHLPGDTATRVAILKSVEGIEDEAVRTAALATLKAQDAGLAKAFETAGVEDEAVDANKSADGQVSGQAAMDELDSLAKAHSKSSGLSYVKAYDEVLKTEQGRALYAKSLGC